MRFLIVLPVLILLKMQETLLLRRAKRRVPR
jgi:hypothetical protein